MQQNNRNQSKNSTKSSQPSKANSKLRKLAKKIELLAPAGGFEQLRAAIANGANAVYLGLSNFNARKRAENFTLENLPEAIELAHSNNVKIYVTLNTLVYPNEIDSVCDYIKQIASAGVDAIIVQDIAVAKLVKQIAPSLPIHASTQMTLSDANSINFAAEHFGISRVILPREISIKQVAKLKSQTNIPLEIFAHGALCIGYSGQCFASRSIGTRSANRGQCAQPCRLEYKLLADEKPDQNSQAKFANTSQIASGHLLSPRDLCSVEMLEEIISAGACSIKIEGRLKSPYYVAAVVNTYRNAIDAIAKGTAFSPDPETMHHLKEGFSRGFTKGYLAGNNHGSLIGANSPAKQGIEIGTVVELAHDKIYVAIDPTKQSQISAGDGVAFSIGALTAGSPGGRIFEICQPAIQYRSSRRNQLVVSFSRKSDILSKLDPGMAMWKTDDPQWKKKWEKTFTRIETTHKLSLDFTLELEEGKPAILRACDSAGNQAFASSEAPVEIAKKRPVDIEFLTDKLGRLGKSFYSLRKVRILADGKNVKQARYMVPASLLNDLRRKAVEDLQNQVFPKHKITDYSPIDLTVSDQLTEETPLENSSVQSKKIYTLVRNIDQLNAVCSLSKKYENLEGIYVDFEKIETVKVALDLIKEANLSAGLVLPRICDPDQTQAVEKLVSLGADRFLIRNYSELQIVNSLRPTAEKIADFSFNCANNISADFLLSTGFSQFTPSLDLLNAQRDALLATLPANSVELPIFYNVAMFHTQYCMWSNLLGTGKGYPECSKKCKSSTLYMIDRKEKTHAILRDYLGRTTIFSSMETIREPENFVKFEAVKSMRVEFADHSPTEIGLILAKIST